jgi:outer membrane protein TolC
MNSRKGSIVKLLKYLIPLISTTLPLLSQDAAPIDSLVTNEAVTEKCETQLSLQDALLATLQCNKEVEVLRHNTYKQEGAVRTAHGAFDTTLTGSLSHTMTDNVIGGSNRDLTPNKYSNSTTAQVKGDKTFLIGTSVLVQADLTETTNPLAAASPFAESSVTFRVDHPLLRDYKWNSNAVSYCANLKVYYSTFYSSLQSISEKLIATTAAYWTYTAEKKNFQINEASLKRLETLLYSTKELIKAGELAQNKILQPESNLASQRVALTASEQRYYLAAQNLKLAMGYVDNYFVLQDVEWCTDEFPDVEFVGENYQAFLDQYLETAANCRYDVQALRYNEDSNYISLLGAKNQVKPKVSVFGQMKYNDFERGQAATSVFKSFSFQEEKEASIGLSVDVPLCNDSALGGLDQRQSSYCQSVLNREQKQLVASGEVLQIWTNQLSLSMQKHNAYANVVRAQELLDDEKQKWLAGESDIFKVLDFETSLTRAELQEISSLKDYAVNIANLHLVTGTTLYCEKPLEEVSVQDLQTLPKIKELSQGK